MSSGVEVGSAAADATLAGVSSADRLPGEGPPPRDPDSPPTSSDPSGPCSRCGRVSNFSPAGSLPVTFLGGGAFAGGSPDQCSVQVTSLACHGCGQCTVVVEEQWVGNQPMYREGEYVKASGMMTWQGVHWWPPPGVADLHEAVPESVADVYAEGQRALAARAPAAASVMFRRALEAIVADRGSDAAKQAVKVNLAKGLDAMADDGALDKSLAQWAREVRVVGNAGAHFEPGDPVEQDEAEDLARLVRALLHFLYEMPAMIRRSRDAAG